MAETFLTQEKELTTSELQLRTHMLVVSDGSSRYLNQSRFWVVMP